MRINACNGHACELENWQRSTREIAVAGQCVDFYTLRDYEKVYSVRSGLVLQKQAELACTERSKQNGIAVEIGGVRRRILLTGRRSLDLHDC